MNHGVNSSIHDKWLPVSHMGFLIPVYLSSNSGLRPSLSVEKRAPPPIKKYGHE